MNIPSKLKIGAHTWRISRPKRIPRDKEDREKGRQTLGDCSSTTQRIRIKSRLLESAAAEIFLHELVHALLDDVAPFDDDLEEQIAITVSKGLLQVIRDNKLNFKSPPL